MKASEGFKGGALRIRVGHWGITKVQQIPNLEQIKPEQGRLNPATSEQVKHHWKRVTDRKRFKEESGQGGLQERKEEARGQGSGGFGSKGFMVNC